MATTKRPLPLGLQNFSTLIEEGYIYIDKTSYIYDLISTGRYYFLSRPRRFGKTLLISTLEELFSGKRSLFKSLFIDSTEFKWREHPIIAFNFVSMASDSSENLKEDILSSLSEMGELNGIDLSAARSLPAKFKLLIRGLGKKNKVVLLVDEYDHPILRNVNQPEVAEKCREVLRDLFAILKDAAVDKHIQFVFLTGVSKFSKTSIFSGLNNLQDITLDPRAAKLLGYSLDEIKAAYHQYLHEISIAENQSIDEILSQVTFWYNGYQFADPAGQSDDRMYNPYSVMLYLSSGKFLNYWFATGTPTFLMRLMREKNYPVLNSGEMEVNADDNMMDDVRHMKLKPLLWQTGYLTIDSYNTNTKNYTLRFPNQEVRVSFYQSLLEDITGQELAQGASSAYSLRQSLKTADLEEFFTTLKSFFAQIPYSVHLPQEKYYQSIFYVLMRILGAEISVEDATNNGRIDAVIEDKDRIFIFEFKMHEGPEKALEQIEDKKYYHKFLQKNKMIYLVGVEFDLKKKNIAQWLSRTLS